MKYGLSDEVLFDLQRVFSHTAWIDQVILFGSRTTENYCDGSDIDLAVIGEPAQAESFSTLWAAIDALPTVFKIDLLHWNTLENKELKNKVIEQGVTIYANQPLTPN